MSERRFEIAAFRNSHDNRPRQQQPVTLDELTRRLTRHRVWQEKDGELWSPVLYLPETTRANINVVQIECIVGDIDHEETVQPPTWPWHTLRYTTWRHTPEAPRYRDVVPLSRPVPHEEWRDIWRRANHHLFHGILDPQCVEESRMYYLPSHPPGAAGHFTEVFRGPLLDPGTLPALPVLPGVRDPLPKIPTSRSSDTRPEASRLLQYGIDLLHAGQGRNHSAMLMFAQFRDNHYDDHEALTLALRDFLPRLPVTDGQGRHDPFTGEELADVCRKVYARTAREPWTPKTAPCAPLHPADDPSYRVQQPPADRAPEEVSMSVPSEPVADSVSPKMAMEPDAPAPPVAEGDIGAIYDQLVKPHLYTAQALQHRRLPDICWIVPEVLPEGLCELSGPAKIGKTHLLNGIAVPVAYGGKAWGRIDVQKGRVLYLALEDRERRTQYRLEDLIQDGVDWPDLLQIIHLWPRMHENGLALLREHLRRWPDTRLIIIDTWNAIRTPHSRGGDLVMDDYIPFSDLAKLSDEHHLSTLVAHHDSVGKKADWVNSGAGTGGMAAAVNTYWHFVRTRGEDEAKIEITGHEVREMTLQFRRQEGSGFWTLEGDAEQIMRSRERQEVYDLLLTTEPLTGNEIIEALRKQTGNRRHSGSIKNLLTRMGHAGELQKEGDRWQPGRRRPGKSDHLGL